MSLLLTWEEYKEAVMDEAALSLNSVLSDDILKAGIISSVSQEIIRVMKSNINVLDFIF